MDLPARLGKYELIEFLGGGMSHVYRATDTLIGRTVAVKILTPEGSKDQEVRERFLQEARLAGNISHENVISIFDFGEIEGCPFMVMEFLQGESLRTLIANDATGNLQQKLEIALQASRAIEYIHTLSMIHRDIKPDNIHVSSKGQVKLIDFGIAKLQDLSRTRAGFVLGTPYYMAPEQIRGERITPLVDVYAFGVVLFEMMTKVKPFKSSTLEETFQKILMEDVDFTPLVQTGIPHPVFELIVQCLAKNPEQRPPIKVVRERLEKMRGVSGAESATPWTATAEAPGLGQSAAVATAPVATAATPAPTKAAPAFGAKPEIAIIAAIAVVGLIVAYFVVRPKTGIGTDAGPTGTANQQPLASTIDTPTGQMILIPAGPFQSGEDRHQETLPDFYIDKIEVTNAAYEQYLKARNRPIPDGFPKDRGDYPVTDISIYDARDYAEWAGKRLPKMLEWEKAARGTDGRSYPWGNDTDAQNANLLKDGVAGTLQPANTEGKDVSPWGILNMGGNASEFVYEIRTPSAGAMRAFQTLVTPPPAANEPWYTFRGGSYRLPIASALTYEWGSVPARFHGPDLGFRCVRDARPAPQPQ